MEREKPEITKNRQTANVPFMKKNFDQKSRSAMKLLAGRPSTNMWWNKTTTAAQPRIASRNRKRIGRWSLGIRQLSAVLVLVDLAGAQAEMYSCRLNGKLRQPAQNCA